MERMSDEPVRLPNRLVRWAVSSLAGAYLGTVGLVSSSFVLRFASASVATAHAILSGCLLMSDEGIWSGTDVIIAGIGSYSPVACPVPGCDQAMLPPRAGSRAEQRA